MDRNWWSRFIFGRGALTSVERSAGRQWLRWWGCGSAALVCGFGIPILIFGTYNYDENLRTVGEAKTVQVTEVEPNNAGSTFTVRVGDRDVELSNPELEPAVGDTVEVVEDEDGRVVLADDVGAKDKAIGDAAFGFLLSVLIFIGLGWGPGLAPFRAVKTVRDKELIKQSTVVTVTGVEKIKAPEGAVLGAWRRGSRRHYAVDLRMPDKRIVRWRGPLPREPEMGSKVSMVAGGFPDDWVVLVTSVPGSDAERVHWPSRPLIAAE